MRNCFAGICSFDISAFLTLKSEKCIDRIGKGFRPCASAHKFLLQFTVNESA